MATRVLVVDDDFENRKQLEDTLAQLGYEVAGSVATPEEAAGAPQPDQADLLLIDINLVPAGTSPGHIQEILALRSLPVIYILDRETKNRQKPCDPGVLPHGFLPKPFTAHSVCFSIKTALERFSLESKLQQSEELYRRLEEARKKAEAADSAKSAFLATMSHEIRTPMNAVLGFAELLLEGDISDEQKDQIQLIHSAGTTLLGLINDILDLSKIESGKLSIEDIDYSLRNVVDSVVRILDIEAMKKVISLSARIDPSLPESVVGDPGRLRQVLFNLVGNAVKFTDEGEVRLVVEKRDGTMQFRVRDTGCGIREADMNKLFKPFSQVEQETSLKHGRGGTGLGLAISRKLVEMMGGSIGVESSPGVGSEFYFFLPLRTGSLETVDAEVVVLDSEGPKQRRILMVEDDPVNQAVLKKVLERSGHTVRIAADGATALEIMAAESFELCFMDMRLPDIDGPDITKAFRESDHPSAKSLPIIGLTASAYQEDRDVCMESGMDAVLTKPIEIDRIRRAIERYSLSPGSG
jgi:two-component system, sensor histidine kinase